MTVKKYQCSGRAYNLENGKFVSLEGKLPKVNVKVGNPKKNNIERFIKCERKILYQENVPWCTGANLIGDKTLSNCRCIYTD